MGTRNDIIPQNLLRKWRKDYKEGKSNCNPDSLDFMELYEYPERYLYNSRGRSNTKTILVTGGNEDNIEGVVLTTKKYNSKLKTENIFYSDTGIKDKTKKRYIEPIIRKTARHGEPIARNKRLKRKNPKLRLKEKKNLKKLIDKNKKNSLPKR